MPSRSVSIGRAERREGAFGVVPGLRGLGDRGLPVGRDAREQDGALDLRARHLRHVRDGVEGPAPHFQRRVPLVGLEERAHGPQRVGDTFHRTTRQALVPGEDRLERGCRQHPREQPHRRTGVAAVQPLGGRDEPAPALTLDLKRRIGRCMGSHVPRGTATLHPRGNLPSEDVEGRSSLVREGCQAPRRRPHVERQGKPDETAAAHGGGGKDQPTMGDRLVARHDGRPREGACGRDEGVHPAQASLIGS